MSKYRGKRITVALALAAAVTAGSALAPAAAMAGGPPPTIPGKSTPAPAPKKSCSWYKFWC
jgi:hypothetical protein